MTIYKFALLGLLFGAESPAQIGNTGVASGVVVSGIARDRSNGRVVAGVPIWISSSRASVLTDQEGRFRIPSVPPGQHVLSGGSGLEGDQYFGRRTITVLDGEPLGSVELLLTEKAVIEGVVRGPDKVPLPNMSVSLFGREYDTGQLRHFRKGYARTDDQGRYRLMGILPGKSYVLAAHVRPNTQLPPMAAAPADPKRRKQAYLTSFYPAGPSLSGAIPVVLNAGGAARTRLSTRSRTLVLPGGIALGQGPARGNAVLLPRGRVANRYGT
ncbi:MAG TPA: hypothetical protein DEH78_23280 [Solibacterales bacterium]|nr:hypothetical protein [Bryobacterales bacterium]